MIKQPTVINVRNLAIFVAGAPLLLLLVFSALDVSYTRLGHSDRLNKPTGLLGETTTNPTK